MGARSSAPGIRLGGCSKIGVGSQTAKRDDFGLANALSRDPQADSDLVERCLARADEPEAESDHVTLTVGELCDGTTHGIRAECRVGLILG